MIPKMATIDQNANGLGKVCGSFNDKPAVIELKRGLSFFAVRRQQSAAGQPSGLASGKIMRPVANDPRARHIDVHAACSLQNHSWIGFAPRVIGEP